MTTFAAALKAAWLAISPEARPYASEAIAAVLLDRAGVTPAEIETGRVIVVVEDSDVRDAVISLAERVWHGRSKPGTNFEVSDFEKGVRVVLADRADTMLDGADWLPAAGETGVGVLMVVAFADDAPAAVRTWSTKEAVLDRLTADGVIHGAVEVVTGTRPTLRSSLADVTLADVRTALGPRDAANAALAMMTILRDLRTVQYERKLAERREKARDAKDTIKPGDKKDEFIAEFMDGLSTDGLSTDERDTPLSKMSGFGKAKEWGLAVAADLTAYRQGELEWADIDRGVLLSGPPGVGKTRFARALAAEAGVPFFPSSFNTLGASGSGSYGFSVERGLKKLFEQARKAAPCIVFLDEMDSVPARGSVTDHNSSYFHSVANAFLEALDGATPRDGVLVIAATNFPDAIDPALKRPGRLDREIAIPLPSVDDLCGIIRHHLGTDCTGMDDQLRIAARACRGMSPADVEQACRDARRRARRELGRSKALPGDIVWIVRERAPERSAADERLVGIHEAGHAVIALAVGRALDHVDADRQHTVAKRSAYPTAADMDAELRIILAGRAAEEVLIGRVTTGAKLDLAQATAMAMSFHAEFGFGDVAGLMALDLKHVADGGVLMGTIKRHLDTAWDETLRLVRYHRDNVERVAAALIADRYLDGAEVRVLVKSPLLRLVRPPIDEPEAYPEWATSVARVGKRWGKNQAKGVLA